MPGANLSFPSPKINCTGLGLAVIGSRGMRLNRAISEAGLGPGCGTCAIFDPAGDSSAPQRSEQLRQKSPTAGRR